MWEPIHFFEGHDRNSLKTLTRKASFERRIVYLNNPVHFFSEIVSVFSYMQEVYYFRQMCAPSSDINMRTPACVYLHFDAALKRIELIILLPKKPTSTLAEGNPWMHYGKPDWAQQSKENVMACAELLLALAFVNVTSLPDVTFYAKDASILTWKKDIRHNVKKWNGDIIYIHYIIILAFYLKKKQKKP